MLVLSGPLSGNEGTALKEASDAYARGDYDTAVQLYQNLAEGGHTVAQFRLALMYERRQGVPSADHMQNAVKWYRRAASRGHSEAQSRLGDAYYDGVWAGGVTQDLTQAEKWHRLAAEQGHAGSQFKLGSLLCWQGKKAEGYAWLTQAQASGNGNASKERSRVCKGLDERGRKDAQQLSRRLREEFANRQASQHP